MSYKFQGTVKLIMDTQEVSDKFKKREIVVTSMDNDYPQDVTFQFVQDKCSILDKYSEGDIVEVSFELRGREWTNPKPRKGEDPVKYFNTVQGWRIEMVDSKTPETVEEATGGSEEDDLPF